MKKKFFSGRELFLIIMCFVIPLLLFFLPGFFEALFNKLLPPLNSNNTGLGLIGIYFFILLFAFVILIIKQSLILIINSIVINKAKKEEVNGYDTAIVIANQENFSLKNLILSPYSYSFRYFFKLAKLKKIKYKIFEDVNVDEFDNIVKNPKIKNYYLFGHGSRHYFELFEKKPIYYCRYKALKLNKDYVAQYHCNHGFGESLADFIIQDEEKRRKCDVGDCERRPQDLKKQWKEEITRINRVKQKC